ncbi:hypothetical protein VMT65_31715 [Nocardia sp. CDC153]|uniref:hypothetical protein n=1 Tax=Nocardia sp. CDC153 TaxID=3112167 RepID=UPI002DBA9B0F|nr:hypothetical protein [Nocardia sp. CDC153]MEC3957639.1 hypothetical protein [Nocardia sp. CDC153]
MDEDFRRRQVELRLRWEMKRAGRDEARLRSQMMTQYKVAGYVMLLVGPVAVILGSISLIAH